MLAAHFNRGSIRYEQEDWLGALADFDRSIAIDPDAAPSYFNRAVTHQPSGQLAEASSDLDRFLELSESEEWSKLAEKLLENIAADQRQ